MKYTFTLAALAMAMVACNKADDNKMVLPGTGYYENMSAEDMPKETATHHSTETTETAGQYDAATGNYILNTGTDVQLKLPNGQTLTVGSNSTESKLFSRLNDAHYAVGKTDWFPLDRVYFSSGKAELTADSKKQIQNIAAILNAFPNASVKFGGYTDNTGDINTNVKVSGERANAVKSEIQTSGNVAANRLAAEGYGPEHPICAANDTKECQAQNRRVDIILSKK